MSVADSLWLDSQFPIQPDYVKTNQQFFGAEVRTLKLDTKDAMDAINAWSSSATRGKIPTLLSEPLDESVKLVGINATYFKGDWQTSFETSATRQEAFHLATGAAVRDTMHATHEWDYAETPEFQAIRLPYEGGGKSMVVFLPSSSSSLDALVASLTAETFAKAAESLAPRDVTLALPKTEVRWHSDLTNDLEALGMRNAMSPQAAQLSRISAIPLCVQSVLHATYLRVDEKGTEAAALTSHNTMTTGVIGLPRPAEMIVDRPYLMAIVDDDSGAVLFLAAIRDPSGQ